MSQRPRRPSLRSRRHRHFVAAFEPQDVRQVHGAPTAWAQSSHRPGRGTGGPPWCRSRTSARARETPAPDLIEAKHLGLQALAAWPHGSLAPENHDLSFGGDNARVHAAFGRRWLQWLPDLRPARTRLIPDSAARRSSEWQRRGPVELDLRMVELAQALLIASFDRLECCQHNRDAVINTHPCLPLPTASRPGASRTVVSADRLGLVPG